MPRLTERVEASTVKVHCARARRRCVPPPAPAGTVSISGDYTANFATRARALVRADGGPYAPLFTLDLQDGSQSRFRGILMNVLGDLSPGVFLPPYLQLSVFDLTDLHQPVIFEAPSGASDGQLVIAEVGVSDTVHHFVHGTLDGTLVDQSGPMQSRREIALHASF